MLSNLHSHTIFCDGKNTPEEMANAAIKKGFDSFGISGHGYTDFDLSYCIKDTDGYINAVQGLKKRLKGKFQLYLGVEEDAFAPVKNRSAYDYIIGSCHYIFAAGSYMPVDSGLDGFKKCLDFFDGDAAAMAESYYSAFCGYIEKRKPDIIGHFDLITKYDEVSGTGMLDNSRYNEVAEKYLKAALKTEALFEVNTGAVFRKYRISPYPCERLLREQRLAVVPGSAFGGSGEGFLRISYAYSVENIELALGRLRKFIGSL